MFVETQFLCNRGYETKSTIDFRIFGRLYRLRPTASQLRRIILARLVAWRDKSFGCSADTRREPYSNSSLAHDGRVSDYVSNFNSFKYTQSLV